MKQEQKSNKQRKLSVKARLIAAGCALALALGVGAAALLGAFGGRGGDAATEAERIQAFWPEGFELVAYEEPPFADDDARTNNAFNVKDFGPQGTNGWFYRYGDAKKPQRSRQIERFDGEVYSQLGCNGLEIKSTFLHTSEAASPILEWRAAETGKVNVMLTYVKNVNGDANPGYPDGVQLLIYKGSELLKLENAPISTTEELLTELRLEALEVEEDESLYFVVSPRSNNAFDGGSLYIDIRDVNTPDPTVNQETGRKDNNANNQQDFGVQGSNGWSYLCGTGPDDLRVVSHEADGGYIDSRSPNLTISQGFIHPSLNHNAALAWVPAVKGNVDLRVKYTKFEQHDGNPDFPDGVKVKVYKNNELLFEQHVDAPDAGENSVSFRSPKLAVTPQDQLFFLADAEGNASYDGGAFDITVIDINGATTEADIPVVSEETRQNFANVATDFGPQGSNGWFFQSGYGDEPFDAYNMTDFDQGEDRYFHSSWLEIKRDYVNPGEHGRSAVIKWQVAQNGTVSVKAAYTKLKNEDANPDWPDGTRVSLYHNGTLLHQQTFAPEVDQAVTKRLDVKSLSVRQGDYITMVVNGLDNIAYDGGNYEFAISSLSGLAGSTERTVAATPGDRVNFASTKDDFGPQGTNGWYYQFGYNLDPFLAANVERYKQGERYETSDGIEIKKDYIVPAGNGKSANVKWIVAQTGRINIDLEYTKLKNEDANPDWPDGVTVYLMHNSTVLRKLYFPAYRDREETRSLAVDGLSVKKGDAITMVVDPGANPAYDGGKYMFVIEDADKTPAVRAGDWDNDTSLGGLTSLDQGSDGWFFLEGRSLADAKILTKRSEDGSAWLSRRTDGLEMKNGYVHTGETRNPIYIWVAGKTGGIDVAGEYMKFGQQDANPDWPDGVTLKIWHNDQVLENRKVQVRRGDGNNNTVSFSFDGLYVNRGDKLAFQICADGNNAWDAGQLSVVIEAVNNVQRTPGDDNNTSLEALPSIAQGTDGWWFLEGTTVSNAKVLTKMNADKTAYISRKTEALEMKKDYVHPGASRDAIYQWIAAEDQEDLDLVGSYVKFGHQDANPDWPDGVTLKIWQNKTLLLEKKVTALQGDGNDNTASFAFHALKVKAGDAFSFQICADANTAWDAGRLSVRIGDGTVPQPDIDQMEPDPNRTNTTGIPDSFNGQQGYDGWYYGACDWDSKNFTMLPYDAENERYYNNGKPELKKDFVEPGAGRNAAYKWVAAQDGTIVVEGTYVKFANNEDPSADGTCVRIFLNGEEKHWMGSQTMGNFADERSESFKLTFTVKAGDELIFAVNPEGNDSWDGGRLTVSIRPAGEDDQPQPEPEPEPLPEPEAGRTNSTVLKDDFSGTQGKAGWYYGACEWNGESFNIIPFDAANNRYYNNGKPELKADYVEPGNGKNAAYKWIVAEDGTILVQGEYVKFVNTADPDANGTCMRIFLNGKEYKWFGNVTEGQVFKEQSNAFSETLEVKAGDEILFAIDPMGNDSYDGGRLSVEISPVVKEADKAALNQAIAAAEKLKETNYTEASWAKLTKALTKAKQVRDNADATQDQVDAAAKALNEAMDALEARPGAADKKDLKSALDAAKALDPARSTAASWKALDQAMESAQAVYDDQDAAQDQVDAAMEALQAAVDALTARDNVAALKDDFFKTQGVGGWYYGACEWDGKSFAQLPFNGEAFRAEAGKPELKADYVEPGCGKNAAYKWVAAKDGEIRIEGEYTKFANSDDASADGTCVRVFLNGAEKHWMGSQTMGNFADERSESFDLTFTVKAGDEVIFAVNPEGNDAWDGGRLTVRIHPQGGSEPEPQADKTALKAAIDAAEALNQADYTADSWANLTAVLNQAKAVYDDAEATQDRVDAAKEALQAAMDALEANPDAVDKTALKEAIDAAEALNQADYTADSWAGLTAALDQAKAVYDDAEATQDQVDAAKEALQAAMEALEANPDAVDKTALMEAIDAAKALTPTQYTAASWKALDQAMESAQAVYDDQDAAQDQVDAAKEALQAALDALAARGNVAALKDDFFKTQGTGGWYYGACDWDGKSFSLLPFNGAAFRAEAGKPELKADYVEPGCGKNAAYKWVAAEDGEIRIDGEYVKFANSDDASADGTCVRVFLNGVEKHWMGNQTMGNFAEERSEAFHLTYTVKAGDEVIFAVNPEGNDAWDGGRLTVSIQPA